MEGRVGSSVRDFKERCGWPARPTRIARVARGSGRRRENPGELGQCRPPPELDPHPSPICTPDASSSTPQLGTNKHRTSDSSLLEDPPLAGSILSGLPSSLRSARRFRAHVLWKEPTGQAVFA